MNRPEALPAIDRLCFAGLVGSAWLVRGTCLVGIVRPVSLIGHGDRVAGAQRARMPRAWLPFATLLGILSLLASPAAAQMSARVGTPVPERVAAHADVVYPRRPV